MVLLTTGSPSAYATAYSTKLNFTQSNSSKTVYTPSNNMGVKIKGIVLSSDTDTELELLFSDNKSILSVRITGGGVIAINFIGINILGNKNSSVILKSSDVANVNVTLYYEEY